MSNTRLVIITVAIILCTAVLLVSCVPDAAADCDLWLLPGFDEATLAALTPETIDAWIDGYIVDHPNMMLRSSRVYDFPRIDATLYEYQLEDKDLPALFQFQFNFQADGALLDAHTYSGFVPVSDGEIVQCLGTPQFVESYHSDESRYYALWYPDRGIAVAYNANGDFAANVPTFHQENSIVRVVYYIPAYIRDQWSQEDIARLVRRTFAHDYPDGYPLQPWPGSWEEIRSIEFQE